jgi:hypothetical protein
MEDVGYDLRKLKLKMWRQNANNTEERAFVLKKAKVRGP